MTDFTHTAYSRAIREHLCDVYGILDPVFRHSKHHNRVEFDYAGRHHTLTLQRSHVVSGFNINTVKMKLRDIRRLIGDPPQKEKPMVFNPLPISNIRPATPPIPLSTRHGTGRLSLNGSNKCLKFAFPAWVRNEFPAERVKITQVAPDSWQIENDVKGSNLITESNSTDVVNIGASGLLKSGVVPFTAHETELLLTEGTLLVRLLNPTLLVPSPAEKETSMPAPPQPPSTDRPHSVAAPIHEQDEISERTRLTAILRDIREVERHTPYRLKHIREESGKPVWAWVVPPIKLED